MEYQDNTDYEELVTLSLKEILRHEDFRLFLSWMRDYLGVSPQLSLLPGPSDYLGPMATSLALAIWNCTPLPGNGFQTKPIPLPGRNQPCICGSGKKFKKCCSVGEQNLPQIDENMIWPLLFEAMSTKVLNKALKAGTLPLAARIYFCAECLEDGNSDKVIQLLKDYYFADSYKNTGEHAAYGLTLLFDAFDRQGMQQKKMELIDHICSTAPSSPLRSDALQRLATIQADFGDLAAAFDTLEKARKDAPHDPGVGVLEVQLLLVKGDLAKARQRALFIAKQIRRQDELLDDSFENPMLEFLEAIIEDPETAAGMMKGTDSMDDSELMDWLEEQENRPVVSCDFAEMKGFAEEDENNPAGSRPHFMVRSQPSLQKLEVTWQEVCPVEPLFGVQLFPHSEGDPWDGEESAPWKNFLLAHPQALDSIVIIDDLLTMLALHPAWGQPQLMDNFFEPLLDRGLNLVEESLQRLPAKGCLPWLVTENRPFLRILVREMMNAGFAEDYAAADLAMQQIMVLNPADNHGFRRDLINRYLVSAEDEKALETAGNYPDDIMAEILYGRVLALYRLGRKDEALVAAREAKQEMPKVASYLVSPQRKEPKESSPFGVISGGKREAWEYREEMRETWKSTRGILSWLKKV